MDFSLSSSLVGSAVSNPDKLALDLQFAADKTLTARKGPTPVFIRASSGTFVGSDGLIQSAGNNVARFDHDPVTLACKGLLIEESRTNLVFPSATLTTQTRTVTAVAHRLSFYGTGTVVLSGASIATIVGSGDYPTRTVHAFTPTAGSLILTVTGTVQFAQLEIGSFVTSYIPTTTGSLTRSADVCSITGSNFTAFYNQSEGSILCVSTKSSANTNAFVAHASDGTFNNGVDLRYVMPTQTQAIINVSNINQVPTFLFVVTSGATVKQSIGYKVNDCGYSANSGSAIPDINATIPTANRLSIGSASMGTSQYLNGTISEIKYFKKRLANAKLQAITA